MRYAWHLFTMQMVMQAHMRMISITRISALHAARHQPAIGARHCPHMPMIIAPTRRPRMSLVFPPTPRIICPPLVRFDFPATFSASRCCLPRRFRAAHPLVPSRLACPYFQARSAFSGATTFRWMTSTSMAVVALRFGKWVELQPFYFQRAGIGMDSTRAHSAFGPLSAGRKVDLKHYGTNVQLNFGSSTFVPFARAGAGVLRLEPDSGDRQDRIALSAGVAYDLALAVSTPNCTRSRWAFA